MLYHLTQYLSDYYHGFHVFQYLTLRAILAVLTALLIAFGLGPRVIQLLARAQIGQVIREDGPASHHQKAGTPTMGGVLILLALLATTLLWADWHNRYIWVLCAGTLAFGVIGWWDDYLKLIRKHSGGLPARWKYALQSLVGLIVPIYLYHTAMFPIQTALIVPFFKDVAIPLGVLYVFLSYFVIVGSSNAVNLTDGLDGLAIVPTVLVGGALGIFAYLSGHAAFAKYLAIPFVPGVGELVVFCGALIGSGLGFLWFNAYPAQVFMGDVGALSLGAALGIIAILVRQELVLFWMGGIFVLETLSVILQVGSFKLRGKRVFRMAPLHHHFELGGWPESRVIVRFWIITVILVLSGLATLKIR